MSGGYILVHRSIANHHAFKSEPFCERMAWVWLLMQASYQPHSTRYYSKLITVGRGQVPTSYRKLAEAWQWSSNRVSGFLAILEQDGMITRKTDTGFIIITICNYSKYQDNVNKLETTSDTGSETPSDTPSETGTETTSETNINKGKEIKQRETKEVAVRVSRGTRLPPDWELSDEEGEWAEKEFHLPAKEIILEAEKFKDYWHARAGPGGIKLDWTATWRNWIRKVMEGKSNGIQGQKRFG